MKNKPKYKESHRKANKKYYKNNRDKYIADHKLAREKLKIEVLGHYSDWKLKCVCCNEEGLLFLTSVLPT